MAKRKAKLVASRFDAADYLDSREVVVEYLAAAIQDKNPDVFLHAVWDVAKARGLARVARETGLGQGEPLQGTLAGVKGALRHGSQTLELPRCEVDRDSTLAHAAREARSIGPYQLRFTPDQIEDELGLVEAAGLSPNPPVDWVDFRA